MRTSVWTAVGLVLVGAMILPVSAATPTTLSYGENFNSGTTLPAEIVDNGVVINAASRNGTSGYGMDVTDVDMMVEFNSPGGLSYTNVIVQIATKPEGTETNWHNPTNSACAFFIYTNQHLWWCQNETWQDSGITISTGKWVVFTIHADYVNETWDLYYNPGTEVYANPDAYGTKANVAPLTFSDNDNPPTQLTNVTVSVTGTARIDDLRASMAHKEPTASEDTAVKSRAPVVVTDSMNNGLLFADMEAEDRRLFGAAGQAMLEAVGIGGKVGIWSGGTLQWQDIVNDGSGNPEWDGAVGDHTFALTEGFKVIMGAGDGLADAVFVSGSDSPVDMALPTGYTPCTYAISTSYGINDGSPLSGTGIGTPDNSAFTLFRSVETKGGYLKLRRRNTPFGMRWCAIGLTPYTAKFNQGDGFWVLNESGAAGTFDQTP